MGALITKCVTKPTKNLNELKGELELDEHSITLEALSERYQTNVQTGLTDEVVAINRAKYGPNALTPPPKTPEWIKFLIHFEFESETMNTCLLLVLS